jgi:hypothetical protein
VGAGRLLSTVVLSLCIFVAGACEPTLQQETGIVVGVDSPSLGRVDSFELLNLDGERLTFDTSDLEFRSEFPAPHLGEHQVIGDQIVVTYKTDGDRLVVTQLDDKAH